VDVRELLSQAAGRATGLVNEAGGEVLKWVQGTRLPGVGAASVRDDDATAARRWRKVTVLCEPGRLTDAPPAPLAALGDRIEWTATPAPADKGTELAARFTGRPTDDDLAQLRRALREAKELTETGEVFRAQPQPHGVRKPTPQGAFLDGIEKRAGGEGVL
jgi:hypothetical protein